jgi:hypothetical protein
MPLDGEEWMDMSTAADVAPEFERLTVLQPTTDRRCTLRDEDDQTAGRRPCRE